MDKIAIAKFATNLVVGAGASTIVKTIIKNHVQPENVVTNVTVTSASWVLGSMVKDATKEYTSAKIDKYVELWHKAQAKNAEKIKENSTKTTVQ